MKKENLDFIKDLFISILIVICIILLFSVIFYDKIAIGKVIPEADEYILPEQMEKDLAQVANQEDLQTVTTYYMDEHELKKYEKTKEYNKGKKNPFAEENQSTEDNEDTEKSNNNTTTSNKNSNNFYEDDGTK